jgi:MFS family permease
MNDAATAAAPGGKAPISRTSAIAVVIGNWLEFYDFIVYTYFAVMIGQAFFPGGSDIEKLLASLAAFGIGFATRPVGAAIIGAYADRAGRRAALTITIVLMAIGSGLVGITPSYAQIGIAAPIILVIARLIQGFSCGGEVGPATTYLLETAPHSKRAAATAWQGYSQSLASIMGSLVGLVLAITLSKHALYAWGWRIPFLAGIVIAPVGLYIRRRLPETIEPHEAHESTLAVLSHLIRHHSRALFLGIFVICGGTVSTYVFSYMTTYAITTLHLSETIGTSLTLTGSVASMIGLFLGVWLDQFGRKPVFVSIRLIYIALTYPAYLLITSHGSTPTLIILVNMGLNFVSSLAFGGIYALLSEAFPKSVRSSGLSILYALGVAIFGATTQFVIAWLIDVMKDPLVPGWYTIIANLLMVGAVILIVPDKEVRAERVAAGVLEPAADTPAPG